MMIEKKLDQVIELLESIAIRDDAFLIFSYNKKKREDINIEANKEGLLFFAKELLKASKKFNETNEEKEIHFDSSEWYYFSKDSIKPFIRPIYQKKNDFLRSPNFNQKVKDKLSLLGYILTVFIVVIIGLLEVLTWY